MSEFDLNEIFLKNDDEKIDLDSPTNTTDDRKQAEVEPEPVLELKPEPEKRGRKKYTLSEEQREKMLDNLKKGRERKKLLLKEKKEREAYTQSETLQQIKVLREEVQQLRNKNKPKDPEVKPVSKPISKPVPSMQTEKEEVVQLAKPPEPKIVYHGYNPNKRRY
jgi:hypothetical protein